MSTCPYCQSPTKKHGRDQRGVQRFRCLSPTCRRTSADRPPRLFGSLRVEESKAIAALSLLTDGVSVRGVERHTGLHRDTILRVQAHAGRMVYLYMDRVVQGLEIKHLQCDEIWSYCAKHDRRLSREERQDDNLGSQFIFLALDPASKFVPCFEVGKRTADTAWAFMHDLRRRVAGRPTIITDGFTGYIDAVSSAFGARVDFAQLVKEFRSVRAPRLESYQPARRVTTEKYVIYGDPDDKAISTSLIERFNATLRCQVKRLSRLTLAYSKRVDNLVFNVALYLGVYNWTRISRTLRCTPAMAVGLARSPMSLEDLLRAAAA